MPLAELKEIIESIELRLDKLYQQRSIFVQLSDETSQREFCKIEGGIDQLEVLLAVLKSKMKG